MTAEPGRKTPTSLQAVIDHLAALERGESESPLTPGEAKPVEPERAAATPLKTPHRARTVARLAAVQALYQMELGGAGVETVVREFSDHRFDGDIEGELLAAADEAWFGEVVRGVVADQKAIDAAVTRRLASNWKLDRIDATLRALLRAGAWELLKQPGIPREVVINEYVELAKAFFDAAEAKFVNAALDGVARDAHD